MGVDVGAASPFFVVDDVAASTRFYTEQLGFVVRYQAPAAAPFFAIVGRGGAQVFLKAVGVAAQPNAARHPSAPWDAFVYTPDPDALVAEWQRRGVALYDALAERDDGLRGCAVRDPDGYVLFFGRPTD